MRPLEEIRETAPPSDPLAGRHFGSVPGHITDAAPSAAPGHSGSARPQFPWTIEGGAWHFWKSLEQPASEKTPTAFGSGAAADELIWNYLLISTLTSVDGERGPSSSSCAPPARERGAEADRQPSSHHGVSLSLPLSRPSCVDQPSVIPWVIHWVCTAQ